MKINPVLWALVTAVVLLVATLAGCEGPAGPAGAAGQNGQTLAFNLEGYAPGIQCATCHSPDSDTTYHVAGRERQWALSTHAIGGNVIRNNTPCSGCHTTEGFLQRMNGQAVTDQLNPTPPGCFTCHAPHARGNFSLRDTVPVTLISNINGVADAQFNYGHGNMCVQCHQPRTLATKMDGAADSLVITTNRWYSHYGVQGQMLMGEGGFKFPGYTYSGNSNHTSNTTIQQEGCPVCQRLDWRDLFTRRKSSSRVAARIASRRADDRARHGAMVVNSLDEPSRDRPTTRWDRTEHRPGRGMDQRLKTDEGPRTV